MRWKKGFEIFLIDLYADDIRNKNIAVAQQKILACTPLYNSLVHIIYVLFICI